MTRIAAPRVPRTTASLPQSVIVNVRTQFETRIVDFVSHRHAPAGHTLEVHELRRRFMDPDGPEWMYSGPTSTVIDAYATAVQAYSQGHTVVAIKAFLDHVGDYPDDGPARCGGGTGGGEFMEAADACSLSLDPSRAKGKAAGHAPVQGVPMAAGWRPMAQFGDRTGGHGGGDESRKSSSAV